VIYLRWLIVITCFLLPNNRQYLNSYDCLAEITLFDCIICMLEFLFCSCPRVYIEWICHFYCMMHCIVWLLCNPITLMPWIKNSQHIIRLNLSNFFPTKSRSEFSTVIVITWLCLCHKRYKIEMWIMCHATKKSCNLSNSETDDKSSAFSGSIVLYFLAIGPR